MEKRLHILKKCAEDFNQGGLCKHFHTICLYLVLPKIVKIDNYYIHVVEIVYNTKFYTF